MEMLSLLPTKEELTNQVVYLINNPLTALLNVLTANQRNLLYALKSIEKVES